MTSTEHPHRDRTTTTALMVLAVPVVGAATIVGLVALGGVALLTPVVVVGALLLFRMTVQSTHSGLTHAMAREVGALVLAVGFGFGAWVAGIITGVALEVLPFIGDGDYPYEDAWMAGCVVVGLSAAACSWWLLRRWADRSLEHR